MKETIFLIVRTDSKRLKNKALKKIEGIPLILRLYNRIKDKNRQIIVCTTKTKSDDELSLLLRKKRIKVFRGDKNNILNRIVSAAKKFKISKFVIVEGDDLFCDPELINKTFSEIKKSKIDIVIWSKLPFGVTPVGLKLKKLEKLIESNDTSEIETGWIKYIIDSKLFNLQKLIPKNKKIRRDEIRLSVDYKEDFELAKKIIKTMPKKFSLDDIINLIDKNPEMLKINEKVKSKYERNFHKKRVKYSKKMKQL